MAPRHVWLSIFKGTLTKFSISSSFPPTVPITSNGKELDSITSFAFLAFFGVYAVPTLMRYRGEIPDPQVYLLLGFLGGMLNFLVLATVDTVMHNPQPIKTFWYLAGLGHAAVRLSQTRVKTPA